MTSYSWRSVFSRSAGLLLCVWLGGGKGAAQEPPAAEEEDVFREEIQVSATRRPESSRSVPATVTIVAEERLEASPALTLDGVLELEVPGFSLSRPGLGSLYGTTASRAVSLRGLGGTAAGRTLVLLDGVPLTDPLQGYVDWSRVPMANIERVEVVRTATSTAWGNLALGGVIQIITRDPDRRRIVAEAAAGELGLGRAAASAAERRGRQGLSFAGRVLEQDGYHLEPASERRAVDRAQGIEQNSAAAEWHFEPAIGSSYEASGDWSSELRGMGTPISADAFEQLSLRLAGSWVRGSDLWESRIYGQRQRQASRRGSANATGTVETPSSDQFDVPASVAGATAQWSRELGPRHAVTAGADGHWLEAEVKDNFRFSSGRFTRRRSFGGESRLVGLFIQDRFRPAEGWTLQLGARLDDWRLSQGRREQRDLETGQVTTASAFADRSETVFNPTLGVVHQLRPSTAIRVSLFSGFRAPALFDLYRPGRGGGAGAGVLESNPDLLPERLEGAELGLRLDPSPRLSFDVAAYWNVVDDPIINRTVAFAGPSGSIIPPCGPVLANSPCRQKSNVGELRSRGLETTLDWRPAPAWTVRWNYARVDSEVTEAPGEPAVIGKSSRLVPRHASALAVDWADPRWLQARLEGRYFGDRYTDDLNLFALDEYFLVDVSLSRPIGRGLEVFAAAWNLLDERYLTDRNATSTELGPPRQISAGVRLRLGGS